MYVQVYIRDRYKKNEVHAFLLNGKMKHLFLARFFRSHLAALRDRRLSSPPFRKCNEISVTPIAARGPLYLNIIRIGNSREPMPALRAAFKCAARSKIAARASYLDGSRMTLDPCSSPIGGISRVSRRSSTYCPHGSRELPRFSSTERSIAFSITLADLLNGTEDRLHEERSLSQPYGSAEMSIFESRLFDRRGQ